MIGAIFGTVVIMFVIYLLIKDLLCRLDNIPEPPSWPIINHTLSLILSQHNLLEFKEKLAEQFKKYGLYRCRCLFAVDTITILNAEYAKEVLNSPNIFRRSPDIPEFFPLARKGLINVELKEHTMQKRMLAPAFSPMKIKNYVSLFNHHNACLVETWQKLVNGEQLGKRIDVREFFLETNCDIINSSCFGIDLSAKESGGHDILKSYENTMKCGLKDLAFWKMINLFPFLSSLPGSGARSAVQENDRKCTETFKKVLANRREKMAKNELTDFEKNDFLSLMMNAREKDTNSQFTDEVIVHNLYIIFLAGIDTSATALPAILLFLAKYPDLQERARKEVDDNLGHKENISPQDLDLVPYTCAFIKESMRMLPAVPEIDRTCNQDHKFGKYTIRKGSLVKLPIHFFLKNAADIDDPDVFKPERYLDKSQDRFGTSFVFGYGPYMCIGKHFAMLQIKFCLVRLLKYFKFEMDTEDTNITYSWLITMDPNPAIMIRVRDRKN